MINTDEHEMEELICLTFECNVNGSNMMFIDLLTF